VENTPLFTAAAIARDRLSKYVTEKLVAADGWDEEAWAFYTFLLEQAKNYKISYTGYTPPAYKDDEATALKNIKDFKNNQINSPQSENTPRGEQT